MRGVLITFEGTEGAGKSTLIREVGAQLTTLIGARRVVITREPGGVPVAERIRTTILEEGTMDAWTELFLYQAARAEHLAKVILPALSQGKIVLCDRFTDSSLAYQGHARGLPWKEVAALNHVATRGIKPNLTVFLDIDPAQGLKRASVRTRFEDEGVAFQIKVRQGFIKARKSDPARWLTLKAMSGSPSELGQNVLEKLRQKRLLPSRVSRRSHG
jgi:dTMP kinase